MVVDILKSTAHPHDKSKRCVGARTIALCYGLIPCILMLLILPWYAIYSGDVKEPDILLSDVMAIGDDASLPYGGIINFGFSMFATTSLLSFSQYSNYLRSVDEKAGCIAGIIEYIMFYGVVPHLFLLLGFHFKEGETLKGDEADFYEIIFQAEWNKFLPWFLHVLGASVVFLSIGVCSLLFTLSLEPLVGHLEPREDRRAKKFWTRACSASLPLGVVLRTLHILHSRRVWALPLLVWETWVLFAACGTMLHGFLRTMMMLDFQSPILDFGYILSICSERKSKKK